MSQQDNFSSGFILGTIIGGLAGGVLGAVLAHRSTGKAELEGSSSSSSNLSQTDDETTKPPRSRKRALRVATDTVSTEQTIELARQSLEEKIAQLNQAIDGVQQQLRHVNGSGQLEELTLHSERPESRTSEDS
ncbi:hypothetical protein [Alkalinema sp. FACHB-956]|uniref:hypothetical protein n=1 Tax=Alkalinema sp. FACHB-956 TaxID=2692768 RepID=UPI00168519B9|nr:hypothetical protein [Alkalinema sp. FACHB-956]MBD2326139.1 hypothetical protein [Alkalinema sp. FACHB-956]